MTSFPLPSVRCPSGSTKDGSPLEKTTYTLLYDEDELGLAKRVEFEALSAAYALEIASGEPDGRQARLLVDGRPLCHFIKAAAGGTPYWIIHADRDGFGTTPEGRRR